MFFSDNSIKNLLLTTVQYLHCELLLFALVTKRLKRLKLSTLGFPSGNANIHTYNLLHVICLSICLSCKWRNTVMHENQKSFLTLFAENSLFAADLVSHKYGLKTIIMSFFLLVFACNCT